MTVNAREVNFLVDPDLSTWTPTANNNSTITFSGTNNTTATFVSANSGGSTSRCYIAKTYTLTADVWYYFSAEIVSVDAAFDKDAGAEDCGLGISTSVTSGTQIQYLTATDNGYRMGVLLKTAGGSTQFRIGNGIAGSRELGTFVARNIQIQEYGTVQPTHVDKYYDVSSHSTFPFSIYTKKAAACLYTTGQAIPQTAPTEMQCHSYAVGASFGDSYGTGGTVMSPLSRYPFEVKKTLNRRQSNTKTTAMLSFNNGGDNLIEILDAINAGCAGTAYPSALSELWPTFDYVLLGTGGNSAIDGYTTQQCLDQLQDCLDALRSYGARQIILVAMPPWEGYTSYTSGRNDVVIAYNAALDDYYRGCFVYQPRDYLQGNLNANRLSSIADGDERDFNSTAAGAGGGDDLHPGAGPTSASEYMGFQLATLVIAATRSVRAQYPAAPEGVRLPI